MLLQDFKIWFLLYSSIHWGVFFCVNFCKLDTPIKCKEQSMTVSQFIHMLAETPSIRLSRIIYCINKKRGSGTLELVSTYLEESMILKTYFYKLKVTVAYIFTSKCLYLVKYKNKMSASD